MDGRKLTGVSEDGKRPVTIIIFVQARDSANIGFRIDNGIGQLLFLSVGGEDGIVIKLIDHVDVCHFCVFFGQI